MPVKNTCKPRLLRTNDAAAYLGISPWKLRNLVHLGLLRIVHDPFGGPWLFDVNDLDDHINRNKHDALVA